MRPTTIGNWASVTILIDGSTVDGPHNAVMLGGGGIGGLEDDEGEIGQDIEAFGAPGIVWRPRVPEEIDGETVGAEVVALRASDSLLPASVRDLRINRRFPAPKPGTVAVVGYGGGFFSQDDAEGGDGTVQVLYCPYAFAGGVATKAHSIIVDPKEEAITVVHGNGQSVLLQSDGSIRMQSPDGQTFIQIQNDQVTIQTGQLVLNGGAVIIGSPLGALVPLLPGSTSPPCPRLLLNPES
jgi:hypothetical protein